LKLLEKQQDTKINNVREILLIPYFKTLNKQMNELDAKEVIWQGDGQMIAHSQELRRQYNDAKVLQQQAWTEAFEKEPRTIAIRAAAEPIQKAFTKEFQKLATTKYVIDHFGALPAEAEAEAEAERARTGLPTNRFFVMKCPKEVCQGFLSNSYECGLCDTKVCSLCHEVKPSARTGPHTCDPGTVETIRQIRREAKPCPTCASLISKIDGCNQMWCTQCRTAFSWTTGQIVTGAVHNPHFFQYMRETGQAPQGNPQGFYCGPLQTLAQTLGRLSKIEDPTLATSQMPLTNLILQVTEDYRHLIEARELHLSNYRRQVAEYNNPEWCRILRVHRLINMIDDAKWRDILQRKEKANYKNSDWMQLIEMYTTIGLETLARIQETMTLGEIKTIYEEFRKLKTYTQGQAIMISKLYGCVMPHLFLDTPVNIITYG